MFTIPGFIQQNGPSLSKREKGASIDASIEKMPSNTQHEAELEKERCRQLWNESWTKTFEWVCFDIEQARMVCNYCKNDSHCRSEFGKVGSINYNIMLSRSMPKPRHIKMPRNYIVERKTQLKKV